jgi:3-phenylpropionate/trans-cinnamate dioxygenase ferredoxin reductase subunit
VHLRTGERVLSVVEHDDHVEVTTDRGILTTPLLLVAIGLQPTIGFLDGSGVACDNGILVDEYCRTNIQHVYAAGDVASHYHPTFDCHVRVEHYDNAIKQGAVAAANMLGETVAFDDPHWFWSDQYEHNLQSVGVVQGYDELVIRGDVAALSFSVFYMRDGIVRSVFGLNRGKDVSIGRRMVVDRFAADPELLRDPSTNLRRMMALVTRDA